METNKHNVIIIGSGPAGFTAALYASRAGMDVAIFEGTLPGGQLMITTEVENYPGFEHGVMGPELMDAFRKQAHRFGARSIYEHVVEVEFGSQPFRVTTDRGSVHTGDAVIISTGATAKLLGTKGENEYMGYGVSACATCDGFFFRGQDIVVIGGGDTAMEEATYLTRFADSVTVIHRREEFRASKIMLDRAQNNPKIKFLLNTVVTEFYGSQEGHMKKLTGLKLCNVVTNEESDMPISGAFIAIGHQPNTALFADTGIAMDPVGYIVTEGKSTYTNIPGVFACGDVQDNNYRQAITAAGSGCMAAIDAERWIETHVHHKAEPTTELEAR